jgi:hypothetical protein
VLRKNESYKYWGNLFGEGSSDYLLQDLSVTFKKVKKEFKLELKTKEAPLMPNVALEAYRKDEFIQDILLGNSIRRVVKKANGKPPLKKKPELDLKRNVVKM